MKNIFKFLSIALVAGAMMVACEKDPENGTTDTTGNTPVNPQPQTESSYKINYLSVWEPGANVFVDHTDQNYMAIYSWKSADDYMVTQGTTDVMINGFMETVAGASDYAASEGDCMSLYDPTSTFHYAGDDSNPEGDYLKYSTNGTESTFTENITSFDANTLRYTATWAQQYLDVEAYATTGEQVFGEMSGTFTNFPIVWYSGK